MQRPPVDAAFWLAKDNVLSTIWATAPRWRIWLSLKFEYRGISACERRIVLKEEQETAVKDLIYSLGRMSRHFASPVFGKNLIYTLFMLAKEELKKVNGNGPGLSPLPHPLSPHHNFVTSPQSSTATRTKWRPWTFTASTETASYAGYPTAFSPPPPPSPQAPSQPLRPPSLIRFSTPFSPFPQPSPPPPPPPFQPLPPPSPPPPPSFSTVSPPLHRSRRFSQ